MGRVALGFHPYAQDGESVKALVAELRKHWDGPLWADEFGIPGGDPHEAAAKHSALLESLWRLGVEGTAVFPMSPAMHDGFLGLVDRGGTPNEIYAAVASAADALYGPPPGPPDDTTLLEAIDVSSNNPRDLTSLIQATGAQVVIVRMYLGPGWEQPSQDYSRVQVQSARDNGCAVLGYWWGYSEYGPEESLERAADLAHQLGVPTDKFFAVDHERYPPAGNQWSIPNESWLRRCGEHYAKLGLGAALYGSAYMWGISGWPFVADLFSHYWYAHYGREPGDMRTDSGYGFTDAQVAAHQYTSTPCDRSRILSSVIG